MSRTARRARRAPAACGSPRAILDPGGSRAPVPWATQPSVPMEAVESMTVRLARAGEQRREEEREGGERGEEEAPAPPRGRAPVPQACERIGSEPRPQDGARCLCARR